MFKFYKSTKKPKSCIGVCLAPSGQYDAGFMKTSKYRSSQLVRNLKRRLDQCQLVFINLLKELH